MSKAADSLSARQEQMLRKIEQEVEYTRDMTGRASLHRSVLHAMARVPRHLFVPPDRQEQAYINSPLPIGHEQTISQPYIVALMSDLLDPDPRDIVLEVGTGSGYQAAVLSRLVKQVYSIEIVEPLCARAAETLQTNGYENVQCRCGNGYFGWQRHAPYDGIIVTAAAPRIPPALVDQLKPGGRLVIPVGFPNSHQELMLIKKDESGKVSSQEILGVIFVPLTGGSQDQTERQ